MDDRRADRTVPADEDELIGWLRRRTARRGGRWIGDDAAVLPDARRWAVTMDSQIEGVHFRAGLDPAILARRLLAVNLSDLAAMGSLPSYAFLALSTPAGFDHRRFLSAFTDACASRDLDLAGGDLSRNSRVTATLTLLGHRPTGQRWLRRSDARVGESLWLGGTLGESAAGLALLERGVTLEAERVLLPRSLALTADAIDVAKHAVRRHLEPRPQIELGSWLGGRSAGAAIDVSDGLARDLSRLCEQSDVGAEIDLELLPLSPGLPSLARSINLDWRDLALAGGEDYVLLFSLPENDRPPGRFGCTRFGTVTEENIMLVEGGRKRPLPPSGWDHLSGRPVPFPADD